MTETTTTETKEPETNADPASLAFEALREEVALVRRAVAGLCRRARVHRDSGLQRDPGARRAGVGRGRIEAQDDRGAAYPQRFGSGMGGRHRPDERVDPKRRQDRSRGDPNAAAPGGAGRGPIAGIGPRGRGAAPVALLGVHRWRFRGHGLRGARRGAGYQGHSSALAEKSPDVFQKQEEMQGIGRRRPEIKMLVKCPRSVVLGVYRNSAIPAMSAAFSVRNNASLRRPIPSPCPCRSTRMANRASTMSGTG